MRGALEGGAKIDRVEVSAYEIPTDYPESDGTLQWDSTTIVVVRARAGDEVSVGYTYSHPAAALLVSDVLADVVEGGDAFAVEASFEAMVAAVRNIGRPGLASAAISAVDVAVWDLKARLLSLPLVSLLGQVRPSVPVYGSGGFTSYPVERLQDQLTGWVKQGIRKVKMKVGRDPDADLDRVDAAREAIGDAELFVDANGAYSRKQALAKAEEFAGFGVTWLEEPVSSDDLEGLRLIRNRGPVGMQIAAGEYGYDEIYFRRMLEAGAVDVLQADATRCGGITGFLRAAALCTANSVALSAHTAPALHAHVCCAALPAAHVEYFHDHVRIEDTLFDGISAPEHGAVAPDLSRAGIGLELKEADAARFEVFVSRRDGA